MNKLWPIALCALLTIPFALADDHEEEREERRRRADPERLEKILKGLEHGMHALEELGRERELRMLAEIAENVRRRMKRGEHGDREREFVQHQIRALRISMEIYQTLEGEKMRRLTDMTEHAIHARELRLEGRRDREAIKVYESAPNEGNVIEMLGYAARLLRESKKREAAEYVGGVAERMHAAWKERRAHEKERGEREREHRGEREREHDGGLERRVARLERSVEHLARILEKLVDEFEELEDDLDDLEDEIEEEEDDDDDDDR